MTRRADRRFGPQTDAVKTIANLLAGSFPGGTENDATESSRRYSRFHEQWYLRSGFPAPQTIYDTARIHALEALGEEYVANMWPAIEEFVHARSYGDASRDASADAALGLVARHLISDAGFTLNDYLLLTELWAMFYNRVHPDDEDRLFPFSPRIEHFVHSSAAIASILQSANYLDDQEVRGIAVLMTSAQKHRARELQSRAKELADTRGKLEALLSIESAVAGLGWPVPRDATHLAAVPSNGEVIDENDADFTTTPLKAFQEDVASAHSAALNAATALLFLGGAEQAGTSNELSELLDPWSTVFGLPEGMD